MKTIRRKCFETNSSSVHSIVYSKDGLEPSKLEIDENGYINVKLKYFGRENAIYRDQYTKLQYLIVQCHCIDNKFNCYDFKNIEKAIIKYTGCKGIHVIEGTEYYYLDHQSVPDYDIEIINTWEDDEIINFVFNKNIMLKTGCD